MQNNTQIRTDGKRALTVNQTIALYNLSRTSIYRLIKEKKLHTVKIAGRRLVPVESLESLLSGEAA